MRAQLIYNPVAGQRDVESDLHKVLAFLETQGWEVVVRQTLGAGDATTYAREAVASRCDLVVAVGGDGTLGEVASGLVHSDCALGVLPVGTGNVWAHMVGLPVWSPMNRSALLDAARTLVEGETHRIDLGRVGERYFVLWSGIGFDAQVARTIEPHRDMRRSFGNWAYLVAAVAQSLVLRGTRMTVIVDGMAVRQRAILVVVSNAQLYGHSWQLAPQAQLDDGLLEVYVFKGNTTIDLFRHLALLVMRKHQHHPKLGIYRGRRVEIRTEKRLPLHMDGDPTGYTPVTIEVVPQALNVIVPSWSSGSLFAGGTAQPEVSLARRIVERLRQERERLWQEGERIRDDWSRRLRFPPTE